MRRKRFGVVLCIGALLAFCPWGTEAAEHSGRSFFLSVQGDLLSVQIDQVSLWTVFEELARQTHLKVYFAGSAAEEKVSVEFHDLPLEEGIKQILKGKSYILVSAPAGNDSPVEPRGIEIAVMPSAAGSSVATGSEGPRESLREMEEIRDQVTPGSALDASGEARDESEVLQSIAAALHDEDPEVSAAALELLEEAGELSFLRPLAERVLTDTTSQGRMEALEPLAEEDEAGALDVLKRGLRDSDPRVRALSHRLLKILGQTE
jgi:hypothetical protein